jgi:elongation factor 2
VTVAVEPKNPANLPSLLEALRKLAIEDTNLTIQTNKETGENLLSGMGELHLEIALKRLREYVEGMALVVSQPRVAYRETVTRKGVPVIATSPNRQNKFKVQAEPLNGESAHLIEIDTDPRVIENAFDVDEHRNVLAARTEAERQIRDVAASIVAGYRFACNAGPLCGEPLRHVNFTILNAEISKKPEYRDGSEITHGMGKAIFGSVLASAPILLEPIYKIIISGPSELARECSRIISARRGKISAFEQRGALTITTGSIPVAETFGLSEQLRSATSGRALWQSLLDHWEAIPERQMAKTIRDIRIRKGLSRDVPKSERFAEENP